MLMLTLTTLQFDRNLAGDDYLDLIWIQYIS